VQQRKRSWKTTATRFSFGNSTLEKHAISVLTTKKSIVIRTTKRIPINNKVLTEKHLRQIIVNIN
jgi:hypothetical protein